MWSFHRRNFWIEALLEPLRASFRPGYFPFVLGRPCSSFYTSIRILINLYEDAKEYMPKSMNCSNANIPAAVVTSHQYTKRSVSCVFGKQPATLSPIFYFLIFLDIV